MRAHLGGRIAGRHARRALRTARALGLHLAELDIRSTADATQRRWPRLRRRWASSDKPYLELTRPERTALLSQELQAADR